MSEDPPADVLSSLPSSRAHRRSPKRPPRPSAEVPPSTNGHRPAASPSGYQVREQAPESGMPLLGTTVEAAAELAEICLSLSARAIRAALARLPRP